MEGPGVGLEKLVLGQRGPWLLIIRAPSGS